MWWWLFVEHGLMYSGFIENQGLACGSSFSIISSFISPSCLGVYIIILIWTHFWGRVMCLYFLVFVKQSKPQIASWHQTSALSLIYSNYKFCNAQTHSQKVLHLFCNVCLWCVISEGRFLSYIVYKLLEWLKFIKKRCFIKFTGHISKF